MVIPIELKHTHCAHFNQEDAKFPLKGHPIHKGPDENSPEGVSGYSYWEDIVWDIVNEIGTGGVPTERIVGVPIVTMQEVPVIGSFNPKIFTQYDFNEKNENSVLITKEVIEGLLGLTPRSPTTFPTTHGSLRNSDVQHLLVENRITGKHYAFSAINSTSNNFFISVEGVARNPDLFDNFPSLRFKNHNFAPMSIGFVGSYSAGISYRYLKTANDPAFVGSGVVISDLVSGQHQAVNLSSMFSAVLAASSAGGTNTIYEVSAFVDGTSSQDSLPGIDKYLYFPNNWHAARNGIVSLWNVRIKPDAVFLYGEDYHDPGSADRVTSFAGGEDFLVHIDFTGAIQVIKISKILARYEHILIVPSGATEPINVADSGGGDPNFNREAYWRFVNLEPAEGLSTNHAIGYDYSIIFPTPNVSRGPSASFEIPQDAPGAGAGGGSSIGPRMIYKRPLIYVTRDHVWVFGTFGRTIPSTVLINQIGSDPNAFTNPILNALDSLYIFNTSFRSGFFSGFISNWDGFVQTSFFDEPHPDTKPGQIAVPGMEITNRAVSVEIHIAGGGANTVVRAVDAWGTPGSIDGNAQFPIHNTNREAMSNGWILCAVSKSYAAAIPGPPAVPTNEPSAAQGDLLLDIDHYKNRYINSDGTIVDEADYQGILDLEGTFLTPFPFTNIPFSLMDVPDVIARGDIPSGPLKSYCQNLFLIIDRVRLDPHPRIQSRPSYEYSYQQMILTNEAGVSLSSVVQRFDNPYNQSFSTLNSQGVSPIQGRLNKFLYGHQQQLWLPPLNTSPYFTRPRTFNIFPPAPTFVNPVYAYLTLGDILSETIIASINTINFKEDYIRSVWSDLELGAPVTGGNFDIGTAIITVPLKFSRNAPPQATKDCVI